MESVEKMKIRLAEKRHYLENELAKVSKAESVLSKNSAEIINMLVELREKKPSNYGLLAYMVRKAIPLLRGSFNVRDIRDEIIGMPDGRAYSKTSIACVLARLKTEGHIEELSKGRGSIPSQYKLAVKGKDECSQCIQYDTCDSKGLKCNDFVLNS